MRRGYQRQAPSAVSEGGGMTCRVCGCSIAPAQRQFLGVAVKTQPTMCGDCRFKRAERLSGMHDVAAAEARRDAANLPAKVDVWDAFAPHVKSVRGLMSPGRAVFVRGRARSGKTVLAYAIGHAYLLGLQTVRYEAYGDLRDLEYAKSAARGLKSADVLIIDGLLDSRGNAPDWLLDRIEGALTYRRDTRRLTLVTTPHSYAGIAVRSDETFATRMRAMAMNAPMYTLPEAAHG